MLHSYFSFCKSQLVAFDSNIQIVAYSYNRRSSTFVGNINNKTRHSPSNLVFLKKYLTLDSTASIVVHGQMLAEVAKVGAAQMQLPINPMNTKHEQDLVRTSQEEFVFHLPNTKAIEITTSNQ